jgi:hypothetical protein
MMNGAAAPDGAKNGDLGPAYIVFQVKEKCSTLTVAPNRTPRLCNIDTIRPPACRD